MCDKDVMQTDDIITYSFLAQEYLREYRNVFDSKQQEPNDSKNIYKDEPLLLMVSTVVIEYPIDKNVEKDNKSGVRSSTKSVVTCYKCGKMVNLKSYGKSNRNGSDG